MVGPLVRPEGFVHGVNILLPVKGAPDLAYRDRLDFGVNGTSSQMYSAAWPGNPGLRICSKRSAVRESRVEDLSEVSDRVDDRRRGNAGFRR